MDNTEPRRVQASSGAASHVHDASYNLAWGSVETIPDAPPGLPHRSGVEEGHGRAPPQVVSSSVLDLPPDVACYKRSVPADPYARGSVLLDVRSPAETSAGHFPGALLIPIDELYTRAGEVSQRAGGRDRPVLVMCRRGIRAQRGTEILRRHGFTDVHNIGGIEVEPLASMLGGIRRPGERSALEWAYYGLAEEQRCYARWAASLQRGHAPDYNALVGAYRHAYGAEVNFLDANVARGADGWGSEAAGELRRRRAQELERYLGRCPL